jgi:hypothetical protein
MGKTEIRYNKNNSEMKLSTYFQEMYLLWFNSTVHWQLEGKITYIPVLFHYNVKENAIPEI